MQNALLPMMDYSQLSDAELAQAARHNADAFTALYRRYVTPLYRYLYHRLGNAKDAEDLTSQVFMEVMDGLSAYRERGYFSSWLFTIARRRVADLYRQRPVEYLEEDIPDLSMDLQLFLEKDETHLRLKQMLEKLDEEQRELLRLRFASGLDFSEIASVLGKNEGAVKMSLYRTLQWLKDNWE